MQVTIDEVSLHNVIMCKGRVNNMVADTLYDTDASISVMSKQFLTSYQINLS